MFRPPKIGDRFPQLPPSKHQMREEFFGRPWRFSFAAFLCVFAIVGISVFQNSQAQSNKLVLISQETSTRAIALDSVTQKNEPFHSTSDVNWGNDKGTRVMLFAMGLDRSAAPSDVTATAEDGLHNSYSLKV